MRKIDERLAELKARQNAGEQLPCPRCGRMTMKTKIHTNALSRAASIMVCDQCGMDEAKLAYMNAADSLYQWALLQPERPEGDFKDMSGEEAERVICHEQRADLAELFQRTEAGEDEAEIRYAAFERLPGLTELWAKPFRATYRASDSTVMIRVRRGKDQIELAANLIPGK